MNENNRKYDDALVRNLRELRRTLSYRNAHEGLRNAAPETMWSFFSYATLALYDGMLFHAMKVLDKHADAASFFISTSVIRKSQTLNLQMPN